LRRIAPALLLAVCLVGTAVAHQFGEFPHDHATYTLTKSAATIEFAADMSSSRTTDAEAASHARRVIGLVQLTVDGKPVKWATTKIDQAPGSRTFFFTAPLKLDQGVHHLSLVDLNLWNSPDYLITMQPGPGVRLPGKLENINLRGEVNFRFGLGVAPPADQEMFIGAPTATPTKP
jgi:hypothetical protein